MTTDIMEKKPATPKAPASKDELIVRQSQLERAIDMFKLIDYQPSIREVCRLSQILTEFIFTWNENADELKTFDDYVLKQKSQLLQSQLETLINDK